jgi:CheY-like chemotaxis protein
MKKILVVENDPFLRRLTAQLLELEGYQVLQAENGCLGLEAIDSAPRHWSCAICSCRRWMAGNCCVP